MNVAAQQVTSPSSSAGSHSSPIAASGAAPTPDNPVTIPCGEQPITVVGSPDDALPVVCPAMPLTPTTEEAATPPADIPGATLTAFKKVALPASEIIIQPPGGKTLVNFDTIFSTRAEQHQVAVHLDRVDVDVVLDVWPSQFTWHHGDGTTQSTTIPGRAWTEGDEVSAENGFVLHRYTKLHKSAQVSVDTTWSARFKVAGTPAWQPVNGTVTITGAPVPLRVLEATPELVAGPG